MLVSTEIQGIPVLVEALPESGAEPTGGSRRTERVQEMFSRAQDVIQQVALSVVEIREKLAAHARSPDQIELQFGIKFTAQGNIVLSQAGIESSIAVKVVYEGHPADDDETNA